MDFLIGIILLLRHLLKRVLVKVSCFLFQLFKRMFRVCFWFKCSVIARPIFYYKFVARFSFIVLIVIFINS